MINAGRYHNFHTLWCVRQCFTLCVQCWKIFMLSDLNRVHIPSARSAALIKYTLMKIREIRPELRFNTGPDGRRSQSINVPVKVNASRTCPPPPSSPASIRCSRMPSPSSEVTAYLLHLVRQVCDRVTQQDLTLL